MLLFVGTEDEARCFQFRSRRPTSHGTIQNPTATAGARPGRDVIGPAEILAAVHKIRKTPWQFRSIDTRRRGNNGALDRVGHPRSDDFIGSLTNPRATTPSLACKCSTYPRGKKKFLVLMSAGRTIDWPFAIQTTSAVPVPIPGPNSLDIVLLVRYAFAKPTICDASHGMPSPSASAPPSRPHRRKNTLQRSNIPSSAHIHTHPQIEDLRRLAGAPPT